jgi:protein-tyrosine phosphatase
MGLVDLHCHILPALDDGALDLRDSVAMGRQADADAIAWVVATPHVRSDHDVKIAELPERCGSLNEALAAEGVAVRVRPGAEVAEPIVPSLSEDELRSCTLGGAGRWLLLEPAAGPLGERTLATVAGLQARGFEVLLAHPERHPSEDFPDHLRALVEAGVLLQLTAAFVADGSADWFLERGLVHVLGSDAHSSHGGRPVALRAGLARLGSFDRLAPHADWIASVAPRAIADGLALTPPY